MNVADSLMGFVVAVFIIVALFFLCREILNWYWKINERITLQKETNHLLQKIYDRMKEDDYQNNIKVG
jgi:divalent metal cation (Fe/Co/Zn/Cd) transporter